MNLSGFSYIHLQIHATQTSDFAYTVQYNIFVFGMYWRIFSRNDYFQVLSFRFSKLSDTLLVEACTKRTH